MAVSSLSLYTKAGAAGNWPKGRRKVHKRKGLVGASERGCAADIHLVRIVVITSIIGDSSYLGRRLCPPIGFGEFTAAEITG